MRFRHPAPVVALLLKTQRRNREQREQLREDDRLIDTLQRALSVQTRRADRWRRTALEMAPRIGPRAMDVCLLQVQSDEIEDLPEVAGG